MHSYSCFSLNLHSEVPLPLAPARVGQPQISIRLLTTPPEVPPEFDKKIHNFDVNDEVGLYLRRDMGLFIIRDGSSIGAYPYEGVSETVISTILLGGPLGVCLFQRGYLVLHASCVVLDDQAYIIVGKSGAGKSSLALALLQLGGTLVSDDLVAIEFSNSGGGRTIIPSYNWMKVDPLAALQCGYSSNNLLVLDELNPKRKLVLGEDFSIGDVPPVAGVIFPTWGTEYKVQRIEGPEALLQLSQHVYSPAPRCKYPTEMRRVFGRTASLAKEWRCYSFQRPRDLNLLQDSALILKKSLQT